MFIITCFGGRTGKDATLAVDKTADDGKRKVGYTQGGFPNMGFPSTSMQMTKYLYFQDVGYYKMYEGATGGWVNAYETCERDGAHLVIINSEKEAEVVAKIINSQAEENNSIFYVGFHMLYDTLAINPDRTFLTVQGQSLNHSGYNIWGYERPPTENYHCGTVDRKAQFDIHSCNLSMPFICEHEL
uniref:C-type lectin domain-containing protein n=1 Tax=Timema poppense TaxID=170557 RepID=A0A7R9HE40_TIMPO|nr:unnamed protein product [Timema poppensis]